MAKRPTLRALLFCMLLLTCAPAAHAYRPFTTEDAGVAGRGVAQLEASWDYLKWENDDRENALLLVPIYGVTERLELSVELPYHLHNPDEVESVDGMGDINLVGKLLLLEETRGRPALTLKGAVKAENGDDEKGLGSGDKDYTLAAALSKTMGPTTIHAMLGRTWVGDNGDGNIRNITLYGLALDYAVTDQLHAVTEIAGNRHPDRTADDDPLSYLVGLTWAVSGNFIFDLGLRAGLNDAVPDWSTTIGASFTF